MTDERDGVYTMAVAARLTGMHPQTLRKYERAGLLTPSRQQGNQRLYSAADVQRLLRIRYLVEVRGVNIAVWSWPWRCRIVWTRSGPTRLRQNSRLLSTRLRK
jgi:predicted site-specific integrase-resolvase